MADTILSKAQAVALLQKLSTDDKFRASYVANPHDAMIAAGIPANVVDGLPSSSIAPLKALADKSVFAAALVQVQADLAEVHACLTPPRIQINFGR